MFKIYYVLYQRSSKTNRERVKEALALFTNSLLKNMVHMINESNEKIDNLCIILVKFLDPEVGNVVTRFFLICQLLTLAQQAIFFMLLKSV